MAQPPRSEAPAALTPADSPRTITRPDRGNTPPRRTPATAPNGRPAATRPANRQNPRSHGQPQSAQSGISQDRPGNETDNSAQTVTKQTPDNDKRSVRKNSTSSLHGH